MNKLYILVSEVRLIKLKVFKGRGFFISSSAFDYTKLAKLQ